MGGRGREVASGSCRRDEGISSSLPRTRTILGQVILAYPNYHPTSARPRSSDSKQEQTRQSNLTSSLAQSHSRSRLA